jgi:acetyl-CoA synthetase
VAEAAVVGISDELTGQAVNAFVSLKDGNEVTDQVKKDLVLQVRKSIGPFAAPKAIFVVPDLPKTRSGKIMRRILRKILAGEEDQLGDISTVSRTPPSVCDGDAYCCGKRKRLTDWQLSDPSVVEKIIDTVHKSKK